MDPEAACHYEILGDNAGGGGTRVEDGPGQDPHVCAQAQGMNLIYKVIISRFSFCIQVLFFSQFCSVTLFFFLSRSSHEGLRAWRHFDTVWQAVPLFNLSHGVSDVRAGIHDT